MKKIFIILMFLVGVNLLNSFTQMDKNNDLEKSYSCCHSFVGFSQYFIINIIEQEFNDLNSQNLSGESAEIRSFLPITIEQHLFSLSLISYPLLLLPELLDLPPPMY